MISEGKQVLRRKRYGKMMTNDQRVRFIAAISRRENLGKETPGEQCGAGK